MVYSPLVGWVLLVTFAPIHTNLSISVELAFEVEELLSFPHGVLSNPENILSNLTATNSYLNFVQYLCILLFLGVSDYILTVCGLPFPALRADEESHLHRPTPFG